ncbi:MAG: winged helix-turn-helix domain-containing protein [Clostridia bacterium]|nr:winged helix-turn-helix domain-containing protein [Clostridia bacterium]
MILVIGSNPGSGKALSMALTKYAIYSAFLEGKEFVASARQPRPAPKKRLRQMNATSIDYYIELYRQEQEEQEPYKEPLLAIPSAVLLLPDLGETLAETVLAIMQNDTIKPAVFALCDDPSAYHPYMNQCKHAIFAQIMDTESIAMDLERHLGTPNLSVLRYGHLRLYADEQDAYLYGKRLYLTPSEYHVLRFLTFHQGHPFNADNIMAYCFASTFARKPANAITHICRINQKAKSIAKERLIACKKNIGYYVIKK